MEVQYVNVRQGRYRCCWAGRSSQCKSWAGGVAPKPFTVPEGGLRSQITLGEEIIHIGDCVGLFYKMVLLLY